MVADNEVGLLVGVGHKYCSRDAVLLTSWGPISGVANTSAIEKVRHRPKSLNSLDGCIPPILPPQQRGTSRPEVAL